MDRQPFFLTILLKYFDHYKKKLPLQKNKKSFTKQSLLYKTNFFNKKQIDRSTHATFIQT
jgi:hypothetical protein